MTRHSNTAIVLINIAVKLAVAVLCLRTGQPLAVLYGVAELISVALAATNACTAREHDASVTGVLVPMLYWLSSFAVPVHGEPAEWLAGYMAVLILLQVICYRHLAKAHSLGVSTWTGRVVQTGPYHIIRHPILALQALRRIVFVAGYPSPYNVVSALVFLAAVAAIIVIEERYLSRFPEYRQYMSTTRFRLMPNVW